MKEFTPIRIAVLCIWFLTAIAQYAVIQRETERDEWKYRALEHLKPGDRIMRVDAIVNLNTLA